MRKRSLILFTSLVLTITSAFLPSSYIKADATLNDETTQDEDIYNDTSVSLSTGTTDDAALDDTASNDPNSTVQDNNTDSGTEMLDVENGQATFTTTLMQGTNRFEIFYKNNTPDKSPSLVFEVNGQSYEAVHGKRTEESDPVKTLSGEDITITPAGQQKSMTFQMLAVYFDTTKADSSAGQTADITVNMNDSDALIITRTQPTVRSQVTDGDETRQEIYSDPDDAGFLLKYYAGDQNLIGADDVLNIIATDDNSSVNETPEITQPKKKDPMQARIRLIIFAIIITVIILIAVSLKRRKTKNRIREEKLERKKAIRKRKEKQVRENDRLSGALKAYADEYTDDEYYEKSVDEEIEEADKAAEEDLQQIPQEKFAAYSPGIKEALYTVGPEEEARLREKQNSVAEEKTEPDQTKEKEITPGASEKRSIVISDKDIPADSGIKEAPVTISPVDRSGDKKPDTESRTPHTVKKTQTKIVSADTKKKSVPTADNTKPKAAVKKRQTSAVKTAVPKKKALGSPVIIKDASKAVKPVQKKAVKTTAKKVISSPSVKTGATKTSAAKKRTQPPARRPAPGVKPVKINRKTAPGSGQVKIKPKKSSVIL